MDTLVLSHPVPGNWPEHKWRGAKAGFSGKLVVGGDLDRVDVGAKKGEREVGVVPGGGRGDGRTVTSKVLALLAAYESGDGALSLTALAARAELSLPTAHRLVGELVSWGALERDAQGRYSVGLRLWEIGQHAGRQLRDTARPHLQDLYSLTQETAHIAIREGHEALYIDRLYSTKRVPRASRVGGRLPLHATAVGKVLLAFDEDWVREAYLLRPMEQSTSRTHVNPVRLADELRQVREQSFALTMEEMRAGSCSIAVPVHLPGGGIAGLGLVLLSTQSANLRRHLPALQGVASRIEAAAAIPGGGGLVLRPRRT